MLSPGHCHLLVCLATQPLTHMQWHKVDSQFWVLRTNGLYWMHHYHVPLVFPIRCGHHSMIPAIQTLCLMNNSATHVSRQRMLTHHSNRQKVSKCIISNLLDTDQTGNAGYVLQYPTSINKHHYRIMQSSRYVQSERSYHLLLTNIFT